LYVRNNHLQQHGTVLREESRNLLKKQKGKRLAEGHDTPGRVRLLVLYWDISSKPTPFVFQTCADRVRARGANHRTLRVDPNAPAPSRQPSGGNSHEPYEDVIWKFIHESQELSQAEVDAIMEVQFDESLEGNVKHTVNGIARELALPIPDEQKIQEGINKVKEYTVAEEAKRSEARRQKKAEYKTRLERSGKLPRYYGFLPELDFRAMLDPVFQSVDADADGASFWNLLKKDRLTP
jgi:tRNA ligase